jgi:tripartite-type tricarboxylate transporter receptor subunit TctC
VQLMFLVPGAVTGHIQSGKLRALAVTGPKPSALLPGLPTVAASGVPGYESAASFGLFAPLKTPDPVIRRLNQETAKVLAGAEMKERLLHNGMEVVSSSPEEFAALLKTEVAKWTKVIQKAGIKDE